MIILLWVLAIIGVSMVVATLCVGFTNYFDADDFIRVMIGMLFIAILLITLKVTDVEYETVIVDEYEIYALQDNIMIEGSGGLLFHLIDSDLDYHVRRSYKDGKKVIDLDGDKVYLIETDEDPKVIIYEEVISKHRWLYGFMDYMGDIAVYVPRGTMVDEYKSDMKD